MFSTMPGLSESNAEEVEAEVAARLFVPGKRTSGERSGEALAIV